MQNLIKRTLRPVEEMEPQPAPVNDPHPVQPSPQPAAEAPADDIAAIVAAAKAAAAAPAAQQQARTCLVVDDSRMIRKVARRIAEGLGYHVVEAENGEEAIARCKAAMPQLVLTDWDMPVMTGPDFVAALRALPGAAATKVVFCTSKSGVHDIHQGIGAGADDYLLKPFDEATGTAKLRAIGAA